MALVLTAKTPTLRRQVPAMKSCEYASTIDIVSCCVASWHDLHRYCMVAVSYSALAHKGGSEGLNSRCICVVEYTSNTTVMAVMVPPALV